PRAIRQGRAPPRQGELFVPAVDPRRIAIDPGFTRGGATGPAPALGDSGPGEVFVMKPEQLARYQAVLLKMAERVEGLVAALENEGLHPVGQEGAFSEGSPFPQELAAEAYEMEQTLEFVEEEERL